VDSIDSLVDAARANSTLEWALAEIIVDGDNYSNAVSEKAAEVYRAAYDNADPIFWHGQVPDLRRRAIVLSALPDSIPAALQQVAMGWACDAVWLLSALERDNDRWQAYRNAPTQLDWPRVAVAILGEARRVLHGGQQEWVLTSGRRLGLRFGDHDVSW
jgi:hypothetical protein